MKFLNSGPRMGLRMGVAAWTAGLVLALPMLATAQEHEQEDLMSPMGRIAKAYAEKAGGSSQGGFSAQNTTALDPGARYTQDDDPLGAIGGQAETSVAVDSTGQHVVIGVNDTRGFALNPVSVSGWMYSDDGGATFVDGGPLPITVPTTNIGATLYPQVFGDPEVVYMGGSTFVYASIAVRTIAGPTGTGTAQTMCLHVSTDNGHTWQGPFIVGPCTNPNGLFSGNNARDAADKEFMHRDPDTGRLIMSWSNFTTTAIAPGGVQICTTYSDNATLGAAATWSPRVNVAGTAADGQSSIPRFAGNGSNRAYVAWRRFFGNDNNTGFAYSTDNGASWSTPINLSPANFFQMDQVLGNDRVNTSPSMDVHHASGAIYVVHANNDNRDGADVAFQRSLDGGLTWSAPVKVNSVPGFDRAQWFPWVSVEQGSGRVHVYFYDQDADNTGDRTEISHTFSDDGGVNWSAPAPITDRPFNAGYGNDTGQPNLGDYNQSVTHLNELLTTWAGNPFEVLFSDSYPSGNMAFPDVYFDRSSTFNAAMRLGDVMMTDSCVDGYIDTGETLTFIMPIENYSNGAGTFTNVSATLTSSTPGITVTGGNSTYADILSHTTGNNTFPFTVQVGNTYVPGTWINFDLAVTSDQGTITLKHSVRGGHPVGTVIQSQNFNGVAAGTLPAGWTSARGGGPTTSTLFTTSNTVFGTASNAAFKLSQGGPTQWVRLIGPSVVVPAGSEYVQIEFDVAYNTEDEPLFNVWTWDGFFLRVTDATNPAILRSTLVEAVAQDFFTGTIRHYPKHLPRSSNTAYFQDMSAWGGWSGGWKHVTMKLPGVSGRPIQLRFEYTEDSVVAGSAAAPVGTTRGVAIDNIVVTAVDMVDPPNLLPTANAGGDQTIECGVDTSVNLSGSGNDPDSDEPLVYAWYQGTTFLGAGPDLTIDAPHETTTYRLEVTDCRSGVDTDEVTITVQDTIAPSVTLVGDSVIKIFCGTPWVDPGATALDLCDGNLTGSISVTGTVDIHTPGSYVLTYSATDDANNTGSVQRTVKVIYDWTNVLEPINVDGSSIFKLGSTIPVKFRLLGECADDVITAKLYLKFISSTVTGDEVEAVSTSAADTGNVFRHSSGQYIYNLATKGLQQGTWQLRIDLGDGEIHTVLISLKK